MKIPCGTIPQKNCEKQEVTTMAKGFWTGVLVTLAAGGAAAAAYKFCKDRQQSDRAAEECTCGVCDCDDGCTCEENTGFTEEEKADEEHYYPSDEETKIGVEITVEENSENDKEDLEEADPQ